MLRPPVAQLALRIRPALHRWLKAEAKRHDTSVARLIREILTRASGK